MPFPVFSLGEKEVDEPVHSVGGLAGDAVEIAVMALVEAERDVDVKAVDRGGGKGCEVEGRDRRRE